MAIESDLGTPQQRLERSRRAIARQLARRRGDFQEGTEDDALFQDEAVPAGYLEKMRRAARVWWRHHPVHTAVDFARPALEDYAHKQPMKLLGIAAGTGAALALLKSFRVLSITGIAVAMLKSSDLTGVVRTFIAPMPPHNEP